MSKGTKPSGTTTSTTTTEPFSEQKPYLTDVFSSAKDLYNTAGPTYYPGSTVAPQTQGQKTSLQNLVDLGTTGSPITQSASNFENKLLGGSYLPTTQTDRLNTLSNVNAGGSSNPYADTLGLYTSNAGNSLNNENWGTLNKYATTNAGGTTNPAYNTLVGAMGKNIGLDNPSTGYLKDLAASNIGITGEAGKQLFQLGGTNAAKNTASGNVLSDLMTRNAAVGAPGTSVMTNIAEGLNPGVHNLGSQALGGLSNTNLGYAAPHDLIASLAAKNPVYGGLGTGTLQSVSNVNQALTNPYNAPLEDFASGSRVAKGNPYTQELTDAIAAQVLPGIQSQFVQGGSLASPEAARASTQGLAAALASPLFQNYQAQQQNQLGAAGTLAGQYMSGAGLQGQTATSLAGLGLGGYQAQGTQAQNLASNILSGGQVQAGAAGTLGNLALGGSGLQAGTAQNLQSGYLTGNQQQATTANLMLQGILTGNQQMINAATALEQGSVAGAGVQQQAATSLGTQALQGQALSQQAANDLYTGYITGANNSSVAANNLYQGYITGQKNGGEIANDLYQGYLLGNNQNITAANNAGTLYNTGVSNMNTGLGYAPQTQTMPYTDSTYGYLGGYLQQTADQTQLDADIARYNYGQTLPYNKLDAYGNQVKGNYGGTSSLTSPYFGTSSTNSTIGTGLGILGLANGATSLGTSLAALAPAAAVGSDRRLKTDIRHLCVMKNGLSLYAFRYRDDQVPRIGLMADEVEKVMPDAVLDGPFGFKLVNYAIALRE